MSVPCSRPCVFSPTDEASLAAKGRRPRPTPPAAREHGGSRRGFVTAMRRNGKCFVRAGSRGSASAAVASQRSLARRDGRGFSVRLPVLRCALVILCLPRTDGSEPFTGCQKYAADEFFSTDLSSGFFPASGYSPDSTEPVPDSECNLIIDLAWWAAREPFDRMLAIRKMGRDKVICVEPGTCEWPPFEPRSHPNLRIR